MSEVFMKPWNFNIFSLCVIDVSVLKKHSVKLVDRKLLGHVYKLKLENICVCVCVCVWIKNKAIISIHSANIIGKGKHPTILPPAMDK